MILDDVLDKELVVWVWFIIPDAAFPSLVNMFPADQLFTLFINFTRHDGTTDNRDYAKDALYVVCIRMLEKFEIPITYRSEKMDLSYYCGISFILFYYENRLF
jgi:hypothetical protein